MITSIGLHDLSSVLIPRLGFPFSKIFFSKFSFQNFKIRGWSELSDLHGNSGKNPIIFGDKVWPADHTSWPPGLSPDPFRLSLFPLHSTH
jgi:hypothetical protein